MSLSRYPVLPSIGSQSTASQNKSEPVIKKSSLELESDPGMSEPEFSNPSPDIAEKVQEAVFCPVTPDEKNFNSSGSSFVSPEHVIEEAPRFAPLTRENTLSVEPTDTDGHNTILLAVKLPDGTRVHRYFRLDETMAMVMHFAEVTSQLDLSNCELICCVPRQLFTDLSVTVGETGLKPRTVLHIRPKD